MGYATRRVKRKRHNNYMRLKASLALMGCTGQSEEWLALLTLYIVTHPDQRCVVGTNASTTIYTAAEQWGIK